MNNIDKEILYAISGLNDIPTSGAFNIRNNGKSEARNCTPNIEIKSKEDKPGIDIFVQDNTHNETIHIPVIVTQKGLNDIVYNDFFIGKNCNITIIAGCGIHNNAHETAGHNGIHTFHISENSTVAYVEKHLGKGNASAQRDLSPETIINLDRNAKMFMETTQLGGVTNAVRKSTAVILEKATLEIKESILTDNNDIAQTFFDVALNEQDSKVNIISRSVAKHNSTQSFDSKVVGNNKCFGHIECDAIVMDNAKVSSTPSLSNTHHDANLTHEAAIGKIAGEQIIKLQTLGLTSKEAEETIIKGFLR